MLIPILAATVVVGLISLTGVFILFRRKISHASLRPIISIAAGTLLGGAFLDLLPEAIEDSTYDAHIVFFVVLGSFLLFFLLEQTLHWHHCHCAENHIPQKNEKRHLVYINLTGDAIHNLIDGFLIAAAFLIDYTTGLVVTLAVILHEIPQEISDFGVLLYGGLSKSKAILYNVLIGLVAVLGALSFYFMHDQIEGVVPFMAAFAAGNFIYLAASDLIPELHHATSSTKTIQHSVLMLVGVAIIWALVLLFPHAHLG